MSTVEPSLPPADGSSEPIEEAPHSTADRRRKAAPATAVHLLVEGLSKKFGTFTALADINMTIHRGHIVMIIGGSGAGKTTLLKILVGLDKPTTGKIFLDGEDIAPLGDSAMTRVRKKLGMVFQYSALLDSMTVFDNVAFPLREHTRLRPTEIRDRVMDKLAILQLQGAESKYPSQVSGGMRKRVGLARALMLEPQILMYDEPTSGLDPLSSRMVDDLIEETAERFGVTSIVISHDMAGALKIADDIYVMAKGRIVAHGSPEQMVSGSHPLVQEFFAASGIDASALLHGLGKSD